MSDSMVIILAIILVGPCIVYSILRVMSDKNTSTLNEQIKDKLLYSDKIPVSSEEKESFRKYNWRRMIIFSVGFFMIIGMSCVLALFRQGANVGNIMFIGVIAFVLINIVLFILTWKDTRKAKTNSAVYVINCYIRKVYIYHGTRVVLIYYDYLQKKYVSKRIMLNTNEIKKNIIKEDSFLEILVQEQPKHLNYVSLRL